MPKTTWPIPKSPITGASIRRAAAARSPISAATSSAWRGSCLGPITSVIADLETIVKSRPVAPGVERTAQSAKSTTLPASPCALRAAAAARSRPTGWPRAAICIWASSCYGTKGSLVFTQERFNELLLYKAGGPKGRKGFSASRPGRSIDPYGLFCVAPGHQLGFNDLKTIEVADFLDAIAGGKPKGPDFREAWEIQKVIDTAIRSSRERRWLDIA